MKIWSRIGNLLATLTGHDLPVNSLAISSDGNPTVSSSDDMKVSNWNLETGAPTDIVNVAAVVRSVAFSLDDQRTETDWGAFAIGLSETEASLSSRSAPTLFITQDSIRQSSICAQALHGGSSDKCRYVGWKNSPMPCFRGSFFHRFLTRCAMFDVMRSAAR